MHNKHLPPLAALLACYGVFVIWRYGTGYPEIPGIGGFADLVFRVVGGRMLVVVLLYLAAFGLGGAVFGRWLPRFGPLIEEVLFKTALGFILISYIMFAAGLAGLLYPAFGYAVIAAGILAGWKDIASLFGRVSALSRELRPDLPFMLLVAVCAYFLIGGFYDALMPPTGFDVLMYHLGVPRIYIDAHRIIPTPDINGSSFPFGIEMLYMTAMLVEGPVSANLVNYSFAVTGGLAAAAFCRRFLKGRSGLMAFALYVSVPMVCWLMPQAYIELAMAFYTMLGVYALAAWSREGGRGWLVAAALTAGFTMSIKYTGIIIVGLAGSWVFLSGLLGDRKGLKGPALTLAGFAAVCLAVSLPWYIKNLVYFGNPVYPQLDPSMKDSVAAVYGVGAGFWSGGPVEVAYRLVSSTWRSTFEATSFSAGWNSALGPCLLMLVPGVLLFIRNAESELKLLVMFGLAFFLVVIPQTNLRYLVPVLPLFAVAAAYSPGRLLDDGARAARWAGVTLVALFAFGSLMAGTPSPSVSGFPSSGPAQVDRYYSQGRSGYLASYDVWKWIGGNLPGDAVVYQLWDDASVYFRERRTLGFPLPMGETGRHKLHLIRGANGFGGFLPGNEIISNLKEMGAGYLLVNSNREGHTVPQDKYFTDNTELMVSHKGIFLYRLK